MTLIEAVLTIVIIALLSAVVMPRFIKDGFISGLSLRTSVSQIASDIRYVRQLAITNSGHYIVKFDFTQKEYNIYINSISAENKIGETRKLSGDVAYSGTDQFDYYALGNCVFLGAGMSLSFGTSQYQISVEPPIGALVIEKIS